MPTLGSVLIVLSFALALFAGVAAIVGHRRSSERLLSSSRYAVYALAMSLTAASLVLVYLFVAEDFSVKYVRAYSDRSMSLFYKATAIWGGQDGSLLFWVWVMAMWSAVAVYQNRHKNRHLMPYTIATMMWVSLFFATLLVFVANPFETFLGAAPTDGTGLNPLLQNPYMVTHPPTLYLGYIGWTIPFCFAMGALLHGRLDYGWIASMRRWCLVAWACLTVGLALGGLWAYEELGWGGYWGWDPVENAAFTPWLTGTAFIHSIQVQERRKIFKVWNLLLLIITFVLTLLGTMMTRSGIVQSVHAFAQSDIGDIFLVFLAITTIVALVLLFVRRDSLRPEGTLESVLSREFALLLNNWALLLAAFCVTIATLFPAIYKWLSGGTEINVGPAFFNVWMVPIGLLLLLLTGIGPLLSWRRSSGRTLLEQFLFPSIAAVALSAPLGWIIERLYGKSDPLAVLTLTLCVFVTSTIGQEFWRGTRYRMKNANEGVIDALVTLVLRGQRRYGGYVVHFGIVLLFVGFAGNKLESETQKSIKPGEVLTAGRYDIRLDALRFADDGQKNTVTADVTVLNAKAGTTLGTLHPAKWAYRKPEGQITTEVDRSVSLSEDLYLILAAFDEPTQSATINAKVNPLINFVWLGAGYMMFGLAIAAWPQRRTQTSGATVRTRAWASVGATSGFLGVVCVVLAFV